MIAQGAAKVALKNTAPASRTTRSVSDSTSIMRAPHVQAHASRQAESSVFQIMGPEPRSLVAMPPPHILILTDARALRCLRADRLLAASRRPQGVGSGWSRRGR